MKFKTTILQAGKTATGIMVPPEIIEQFGVGKKPPVRITINGYTYRNTVAVMGGVFMVGVSAEHRKGANVAGGDEIEVTIELDTAPREVEVPAEFQKALNKNTVAKKNFEALSYSKKQGSVLPIKDAKTEETKIKRIEKAINMLCETKNK
ncbi:MAG: YdeI/OmpD-associated family protein [Bacteroidota bacterium]|nr:YdeI/OmpD-associated family protein [Bacteroidota bacterium]